MCCIALNGGFWRDEHLVRQDGISCNTSSDPCAAQGWKGFDPANRPGGEPVPNRLIIRLMQQDGRRISTMSPHVDDFPTAPGRPMSGSDVITFYECRNIFYGQGHAARRCCIAKGDRIMIRTVGKAGMIAALAGALMLASCSQAPDPATGQRKEFSIGWSIYAGWMPWPYAQQAAS